MSQLAGLGIPGLDTAPSPANTPAVAGFEDGRFDATIDAVRQNGSIITVSHSSPLTHALESEITYDWHPWVNQRVSFAVVNDSTMGKPANTRAAYAPFHIVPAKAGDPCEFTIQAGVVKLIVQEGVYGEACP